MGENMDIISTTELRRKEIINLCDGSRLGFACDFEFDRCSAQITGLILEQQTGFLGLCAGERVIIPWCKIQCIGEDTILVNFTSHELNSFCKKKKKKLFEFD
jgi:YlmC/YmxH family sporulation protein